MGLNDSLLDAYRQAASFVLNDEGTGAVQLAASFVQEELAEAGAFALRYLMGNEGFTNPIETPAPEVTGGQCVGVEYIARAPDVDTSLGRGFGPVSASTSFGTLDGRPTFTITVSFAGGLISGSPVSTGFDDGPSPTRSERYTGVVAERVDGLPDDCGDSPVSIPPYAGDTVTVNIDYGDETNIPVTVGIFAPIVGSFNTVYAPVTFDLPDFTLNGTVELFPDFKLELFPNGLLGPGGGAEGIPDPDVPVDSPDDEEETDLPIVGAITVVTSFDPDVSKATQIAQSNTPDLYLPRAGNLSFWVPAGDSGGWTQPLPVQTGVQYFPVVGGRPARDVRVSPETGFVISVTPVFGEPGERG